MKVITTTVQDPGAGIATMAFLSMEDAIAALRENYDPLDEYADEPDSGVAGAIEGNQGLTVEVDEHDIGLNADHLHVILDCLQFTRVEGLPEHFSQSYDDPADDDPKGTPEGWERTRAEAEVIAQELLGRA